MRCHATGEPIAYVAETEGELDEAKSKAGGGSSGNGASAAPPPPPPPPPQPAEAEAASVRPLLTDATSFRCMLAPVLTC